MLLLATPASFFARLLPWLVLFATSVFAWGSFLRKPSRTETHLGPMAAGAVQFGIAIYGGYFGGGIGFLMLAALTIAGLGVRAAGGDQEHAGLGDQRLGRADFSSSPPGWTGRAWRWSRRAPSSAAWSAAGC